MSNISNKIIASEQNSNSLTNNVSNDAFFINDYITIAIEFPNKPSNIFKIIQQTTDPKTKKSIFKLITIDEEKQRIYEMIEISNIKYKLEISGYGAKLYSQKKYSEDDRIGQKYSQSYEIIDISRIDIVKIDENIFNNAKKEYNDELQKKQYNSSRDHCPSRDK
jgi:hypothetical protein